MNLKTLVVLPLILLGVSAIGAADELPPREAMDAWRQMIDRARVGTYEVAGKTTNDRTAGSGKVTVYIDGDKIAFFNEETKPDGTTRVEGHLKNKKGVFGIERINDGPWRLAAAESFDNDRAKFIVREDRIRAMMVPAIFIYGTTVDRVCECPEASISGWQGFTDDSGHELARFHVSVERDNLEYFVSGGEYDIVVDPNHNYRIVVLDVKYPSGMKHHDERRYDRPLPNDAPAEQITELYDPQVGKTRKSVSTTIVYTNDPPDPEVFELSHYGIEDVEFATEPSYWWLYALGGLLAAICLMGYIVLRKRRA